MKLTLFICFFTLMVSGQSVAAKLEMADTMLKTYNYSEAASIMQSVISDASLSAEDRFFAASVFCLNRQFTLAIQELYKVVRSGESFEPGRIIHNKDFAALQQDANWPELVKELTLRYQKASLLVALKKYIETDTVADIRAYYGKLLKDSSHYNYNLAEINEYSITLCKTKLTLALQLLNETHRFFPKDMETTMLLAEAYEQAGDKYMARQIYEETLALKPDGTLTYILLKRIASLTKQD